MKQLVIYHKSCADGFTAAWCAWATHGDAAEYLPAQYGDAPPDVTGRHVLIVDFSYPRDIMIAMAERAASILVLDHHKTAQANLDGLPFALFDMNRSGAGLAWDELHGGKARPAIVDYVEDRDLWRWRLRDSREINAWIQCVPFEFVDWSNVARMLDTNDIPIYMRGCGALGRVNAYVREQAAHAQTISFEGHDVPCVNTTFAISELLNELAKDEPFAIGWFQRKDGRYVYSLRSCDRVDVSDLARRFGGGGHKNAAGFETEHPIPMLKPGEATNAT